MFIFGEHARELISPETALAFAKYLCEPPQRHKKSVNNILNTIELVIFPNVNPLSRQRVESGEYCLRTNENGVDLNRNWKDHWESDETLKDTDIYSGAAPFSEQETNILKNFVSSFRPHLFLTVHSGALGLLAPYAYTEITPSGAENVIQMMSTLQNDCPACGLGSVSSTLHYRCPGTCLDYVYDTLRTPYAMAFEIYDGVHNQKTFKVDGFAPLNMKKMYTPNEKRKEKFPLHDLSILDEQCLRQFNPTHPTTYKSTIQRWNSIYRKMLSLTVIDYEKENQKRKKNHDSEKDN